MRNRLPAHADKQEEQEDAAAHESGVYLRRRFPGLGQRSQPRLRKYHIGTSADAIIKPRANG